MCFLFNKTEPQQCVGYENRHVIGSRFAGASMSRTANYVMCFKDQCIKGYDSLPKSGLDVFCEAQLCENLKKKDLYRRALKRIFPLKRKTTLSHITSEMNNHLQNPRIHETFPQD
ncbi:hypothetical protein TNCV_3515941 [Trichonephila clavipes]|nr:hypothetical protein TNCV_3515941 [Trichonephila clavipes]